MSTPSRCSRYRITRISRSRGDISARAVLTWSRCSCRIMRLLGLVSLRHQLLPELHGRLVGQVGVVRFTVDAAALRANVPSVGIFDRLRRELSQPAEERQRLIAEVVIHPP